MPRVQNWPALLGSHCSKRTMEGSLFAPLMNSSRESFPGTEHKSGGKVIVLSVRSESCDGGANISQLTSKCKEQRQTGETPTLLILISFESFHML